MPAVLGVDPGVNGGLAVLHSDASIAHVRAFKPEMTHVDLVDCLKEGIAFMRVLQSRVVYVEKVGYMPTDGGKGANTFGRVDGLIRGGLLMAGYPPRDVMPMTWQAAMGCLTGGNKSISKARAQELYPKEKITHAIADAILIARYGVSRQCSAT